MVTRRCWSRRVFIGQGPAALGAAGPCLQPQRERRQVPRAPLPALVSATFVGRIGSTSRSVLISCRTSLAMAAELVSLHNLLARSSNNNQPARTAGRRYGRVTRRGPRLVEKKSEQDQERMPGFASCGRECCDHGVAQFRTVRRSPASAGRPERRCCMGRQLAACAAPALTGGPAAAAFGAGPPQTAPGARTAGRQPPAATGRRPALQA